MDTINIDLLRDLSRLAVNGIGVGTDDRSGSLDPLLTSGSRPGTASHGSSRLYTLPVATTRSVILRWHSF